jgi:recombinational DNA repair protein RecT
MPISSLKKSNKIWWSQDYRNAVLSKKKARNNFQRHQSQETFIALRKAEALVKKTVLKTKCSAWNDFSSEIDHNVPASKIPSFINRMAGNNKTYNSKIPCLTTTETTLKTDKDITEAFAIHFKKEVLRVQRKA